MPFVAGQTGNPNPANNGRPWKAAIARALARAEADGKFTDLNKLADKLLEKAAEGDMAALKELGDRLDGRSVQAIAGADGTGPVELLMAWAKPGESK